MMNRDPKLMLANKRLHTELVALRARLSAADALAVALEELIDSITNDNFHRVTLLEYRACEGRRLLKGRIALRQYENCK